MEALTGINLESYKDTLELCQGLDDAWYDGHVFTSFNYDEGSQLQAACMKYLQSTGYLNLFGHSELSKLKASQLS